MQFTMIAGARLQFSGDPEKKKKIIFAAEISGRYLVDHLLWSRKGNYWVGQKVHPGFGNPINAAIKYAPHSIFYVRLKMTLL